eukprot:TRINITY_DN704_c1_g1_i2.p1 TRINITY_DN704_c1_g1~~TRINITY_DN704_c1_g1_i2.p1  ORF type:complete len:293 (+),score=13.09 TRINITY_DN704_c1_g1_i2:1945-2823(+)
MLVSLNGQFYNLQKKKNITIFQLCNELGIEIPCFCYHEKLTIAGNCRMCLVEVQSSIKLVIACAMSVMPFMKILTNTSRVLRARKSILEFLLISHPLDCPICDQASECDLQDLTISYGSFKGRFFEKYKRSVVDQKENSVIIKLIITRCIHCLRCVRFLEEFSSSTSLGTIGRGAFTQIGSFIKDSFVKDEISANVVDLCPVGALTSNAYSFVSRSWELENFNSFDILDSMGSSILVHSFNNKIVRILPHIDNSRNEDWITNKARFMFDALTVNRLMYPAIFVKYHGLVLLG